MALESSGTLSIGGSTTNRSINLELGRSATATSNLNETDLRTLAGVSSGTIAISNFHGKSSEFMVQRSVRFNSADLPRITRTCGTPTSSGTWTFSCWVKRSDVFGTQSPTIFSARSGTNPIQIYFPGGGDDRLRFYDDGRDMYTNHRFRDPSAWAHIVVTRSPTANSIYINNVLDKTSTFSSSTSSVANVSGANHALGMKYYVGSQTGHHGDFYLADSFFIDGQALAPSNFGEYDNDDAWNPKDYSGTYGSNGWRLQYNNNSSVANLVSDSSGNSNNFSSSGISVSSGSGNDSLRDSPFNKASQTDSGAGGTVIGNYPTWNRIDYAGVALAEGNLQATVNGGYANGAYGTMGVRSGKYYWEITPITIVNSAMMLGIADLDEPITDRQWTDAHAWAYYSGNGNLYNNNSSSSFGSSYSAGDVIGFAVNMDNGSVTVYKNGSSQGTITGLSGKTITPYVGTGTNSNGQKVAINFGQRAFSHNAPSSYKCLCSSNLPTPAVANGADYFDVKLWTGTGNSRSITGYEFSPDFVWIKRTSGYRDHALFDTVRGTTKTLRSNTNGYEQTYSTSLTSFNSDGFTIGGLSFVNTNSANYVGFAWDAGSSTVTNSDGSYDSQVRANQTAGFSIVKANISSGTVGHGLNAVPSLIITKTVNSGNWIVHGNVFSSPASNYLKLNDSSSVVTDTSAFNNTAPTSSTFNFNAGHLYGSSHDCISYCFAPVEGYSAFGTYTGNNSADFGPFIYTGFRPRFILVKAISSVSYGNWVIHDTGRSTYNVSGTGIYANLNNPEDTTYKFDFLSNGFKVRSNSYDGTNGNGKIYLYAAFAEHPLNTSRAR